MAMADHNAKIQYNTSQKCEHIYVQMNIARTLLYSHYICADICTLFLVTFLIGPCHA